LSTRQRPRPKHLWKSACNIWYYCRANMAHTGQSRPGSGLVFQEKDLGPSEFIPLRLSADRRQLPDCDLYFVVECRGTSLMRSIHPPRIIIGP